MNYEKQQILVVFIFSLVGLALTLDRDWLFDPANIVVACQIMIFALCCSTLVVVTYNFVAASTASLDETKRH